MGLLSCLGCQSGDAKGSKEKNTQKKVDDASKNAPNKEDSNPDQEFSQTLQIKDSELEDYPKSTYTGDTGAAVDPDGDFYSALEEEEEEIPTHVDNQIPSGLRM